MVALNPHALAEAAESDRRWAAGQPRALEGVPFIVKDSYMVASLTVAAGSPAFARLVAQWDAFTVSRLREAGAVLIGKTNVPPMADGGMQRGVYGRAENPYNRDYLAAAYASGSSNGSGVATTANFAMFGMGEETVSLGRSPASNTGLCAYTPSWGILSIRGNWPLFPARDVVVPHTRSMPDMLRLLDVFVQDDEITRGDFPKANGDPALAELAVVDPDMIFPQPPGTLPDRYEEVADYANRYRATVASAQAVIADPRERDDFAAGLTAFVRLREELFEAWLDAEGFDGVVFPANGDVGREDAERDIEAADHAGSNGVFFSNGNYALRHLGIPSVTVAMGIADDIGVPVGITFAGLAYSDPALLGYASAFEAGASGSMRVPPSETPALPGDLQLRARDAHQEPSQHCHGE